MPQTSQPVEPAESLSAAEPIIPAVDAEEDRIHAGEDMDSIRQLARIVFAAGCIA